MCGPLMKEETHRVSWWTGEGPLPCLCLYPRGGRWTQERGSGLEGWHSLSWGRFWTQSSLQRLHDLVLPLVMSVQQGEVPGSSPYNSSCCRRELYRLLLALLLAPSPRCPPPLACALKAFSLGQWEDSLEVGADGAGSFSGPWVLPLGCLPVKACAPMPPPPLGLLLLLGSTGDLRSPRTPPSPSSAGLSPDLPSSCAWTSS